MEGAQEIFEEGKEGRKSGRENVEISAREKMVSFYNIIY